MGGGGEGVMAKGLALPSEEAHFVLITERDFCPFLSLASNSALSMIIGSFPIRISYPLKNHLRGIVRSESQCLFAFTVHVKLFPELRQSALTSQLHVCGDPKLIPAHSPLCQ